MYAATGDERFKERADYLVKEMKEVQDKHGDGYLGALGNKPGVQRRRRPAEDLAEGRACRRRDPSGFDLNGMWSPWYTLHKTYAGLRDAYRYTGNKTALEVEVKFAEWAEKILAPLDDEQIQKMLNTEFGGMNEIWPTSTPTRATSAGSTCPTNSSTSRSSSRSSGGEDNLAGKHGNTQVPKLIGSLARYAYAGDPTDLAAARFFWERVADHHSFATGGHGKDEYFGEPDKLSDRIDGRTAETCNVYNMLKLTRTLFALDPERRVRRVPRAGAVQSHSGLDRSGRRQHVLHGAGGHGRAARVRGHVRAASPAAWDRGWKATRCTALGIYYEAGERLWVNLYAPSTAEWKAAGVQLEMDDHDFPEGESATLTLDVQMRRRNSRWRCGGRRGRRWLSRRGKRRGGRRLAEAGRVRRNQAHVEDRRQSGAHAAEEAAPGAAARQPGASR